MKQSNQTTNNRDREHTEIMKTTEQKVSAQLATLDDLLKDRIPLFVSPVPTKATLRSWFDAAKIPRFKANPVAKRGGGPCFYSVPAVEKLFRSKNLMP